MRKMEMMELMELMDGMKMMGGLEKMGKMDCLLTKAGSILATKKLNRIWLIHWKVNKAFKESKSQKEIPILPEKLFTTRKIGLSIELINAQQAIKLTECLAQKVLRTIKLLSLKTITTNTALMSSLITQKKMVTNS